MHKLNPPTKPDVYDETVKQLSKQYPPASCSENARWEAFRDEGVLYPMVRETLKENQRGICAYCEIPLSDRNKQIEHFIPKKMTSPTTDYTYDFSNMLLCCVGGTNPYSKTKGEFLNNPTAQANHSCGEAKGGVDPKDCCLNPYELPDYSLFTLDIDIDGIKFAPDEKACQAFKITTDVVDSTINLLNLNCPRLMKRRQEILDQLEKEMQEIENQSPVGKKEAFSILEKAYLYDAPAFYTTKRLYLMDYIEDLR